ncbi:MAG: M23 family metallopeptidase [Cyanobacteria bacterium J06638_28]
MSIWKHPRSNALSVVLASLISTFSNFTVMMTAVAAQTAAEPNAGLCPPSALSRVRTHLVGQDETVASIATVYKLLPATLLGMNPNAQMGTLTAGMTLKIPPFNGIEVSVKPGETWQDLATQYRLRADILFEVNGCPTVIPDRIFVPGVNWFPGVDVSTTDSATATADSDDDPLTGYPLSEEGTVMEYFGWRPHPEREELIFNSGITLTVESSGTVLAAGSGTVAYVGDSEIFGTLIVVNHAEGLQTRYVQAGEPQVASGDRVQMGQVLATLSPVNETEGVLYFEVRSNSALGWVARDPGDFIPAFAIR